MNYVLLLIPLSGSFVRPDLFVVGVSVRICNCLCITTNGYIRLMNLSIFYIDTYIPI